MCGIAGIVSLSSDAPVDAALAQRMADVIAHRGPDADGVYISPDRRSALSNRRLAIQDLSAAGHMNPLAAAILMPLSSLATVGLVLLALRARQPSRPAAERNF